MRPLWTLLAGVLAVTAMSSPALAQFPGEPSAVVATDCDYKCLTDIVRGYMDALAKRDTTRSRKTANRSKRSVRHISVQEVQSHVSGWRS